MQYLGDFAEDATVYIPFNTFSSNDPAASVTATTLIASDIYVHKDGSITNIVTDGATVVIDFDGIAGNHLLTIDTSAHADYAVGSDYLVRIEGMTVDAGLVNAIVGSFSIENRFNAAADDLANATDGLGALKTLIDAIKAETVLILADTGTTLQAELDAIQAAVITNAAGVDIAADIIALKAETALIVADTNELQTDDVPGLIATLDAVVDTVKAETVLILADTGTTLQAELDAIQAAVITNAAGVDIAADIIALKAETALIVADTNELQTDDIPAKIAALDAVVDTVKAETVLILADTSVIGVAGAGLTDLGGMSTGMKAEVNVEVDSGFVTYDGPTNAEMEARTPTAAELVYIVEHAKTAKPVTFSGGSTTTAVLTNVDGAAASTVDDFYNGRILIFNAGTLAMVATDITDYVGSTKTATITAVPFAVAGTHTARLV